MINIEAKKAEGKGVGYEKWAKLFNLKQSAKALLFMQEHNIQTIGLLLEKKCTIVSSVISQNKLLRSISA